MSGHSDGAFDGPGGLDGGTHFIGKPFSSAQLKLKVREVLSAPRRDAESAALEATSHVTH
jgi:hypothetical protein